MIYVFLTWLLYPFLALRARRRVSPQPQRIALMQTAKIGDFVCTTPLFREIKRRYPDCHLLVIGQPINEALAHYNPAIDEYIALPSTGLHGWRGKLWLIRELYSHGIDTCICISPSLSAFLAPLWAGVSRRLAVLPNFSGNSYRLAQGFLTHVERHQAGRLLLDTWWALLAHLDIYPSETHKEAWAAPNSAHKLTAMLVCYQRPWVGLGISSGNKLKALHKDQLEELIRNILVRTPATVVLVGSQEDIPIAQEVSRSFPRNRLFDAVGQFDLVELPALLSPLSVYLGVDSGITYLAEASGVKVIDLMGPSNPADQRPTGKDAIVITPNISCAPCSHAFQSPYSCKIGTQACVRQIKPDEIVDFLIQLLIRSIKT